MDAVLEQIKDFADRAHDGQQRKYTPERYIVHPVRVMEICREYSQELPVLAAALLHDVLEDTPVSKEQLHQFLASVMNAEDADLTLKLVVELTDVFIKKDYPQWNRKKRKAMETERIAHTSSRSQTVKYADMLDNCREIVEHDPDFGRRFLNECRTLLEAAGQGNAGLRSRAIKAVDEGLEKLQVFNHYDDKRS
jgi:guanosine-3',5'-bis(diphosphate) 3'-pyrophosphohydrolase